ncbi:hypothetical protein I540_6085 [Mycobacteroides abscessus subsp. bolletii 1513]|uniref:Uncharacterized protein n=1 Tax=Mycobacteroides abscessus subsp. bolletii 1513 TaxID=1299321 RepID=X8DEF1_9MYCO|nr:hypothetical protein I540_6085 [Mycobacteroides abscessus subsp. bolletii 1513]
MGCAFLAAAGVANGTSCTRIPPSTLSDPVRAISVGLRRSYRSVTPNARSV